MNDHRKLQRTLFRMQLDPDFARAVFEREPAALASTELVEADLSLLLKAAGAGVGADHEGRRKAQFLRNVASELPLACALLEELDDTPALRGAAVLDGFAAAPEFHDTIARAGRLPLAFASYARRRAHELGRRSIAALSELESALIVARRTTREPAALEHGEVVLAPHAHLCELDAGTFAHAERVRQALDAPLRAAPLPQRLEATDERETVLILAQPAPARQRLRTVEVELLAPAVARLLRLCSTPAGSRARAAFARASAVESAEIERFVDALVADGVLVREDRAP